MPPYKKKTRNFKKAKKETIEKYQKVYTYLFKAGALEGSTCGFCKEYGCSYCPAHTLCQGEFRGEATSTLSNVTGMTIRALKDLEDLEDPNAEPSKDPKPKVIFDPWQPHAINKSTPQCNTHNIEMKFRRDEGSYFLFQCPRCYSYEMRYKVTPPE